MGVLCADRQLYYEHVGSEDLSFALQLCSIPGVGLQGKSFDFLSFAFLGLKWRKHQFIHYSKSNMSQERKQFRRVVSAAGLKGHLD